MEKFKQAREFEKWLLRQLKNCPANPKNTFTRYIMNNIKLLFFLILAVGVSCVNTMAGTVASDYSFVNIGSENGLSQSNVKTILQDSYGFMWFGTKNGLNRYDGSRIVAIDCCDHEKKRSNHNISALFEDVDRRLWVGTDEGVYIYDIKHDEFEFIDNRAPDGVMMENWVACIDRDYNGNIWIVVPDKGIFRWSDNDLFHYTLPSHDQPSDLCVTEDGCVWVCGWNMGLMKYDPAADKFVQVSHDSRGRSLLGIETNTISADGDCLLMAVQSGGLMKYDFVKNVLADVVVPELHHTFVRNAEVYGDEIWAGTHNGLYVINEKNGDMVHLKSSITEPNSLSDNIIYTIYRDREGGTWLGTMFGGVNYYAKRNLNFMKLLPRNSQNSLSSRRIRELVADGDCIYVGTEDAGMNVLDVKALNVTRITYPTHMKEPVTLALCSYDGNAYCSYFKEGLQVIDRQGHDKFYFNSQLGIKNSIYAMTVDSKGRFWAGGDAGLYCSLSAEALDFKRIDDFADVWIWDILETGDDELWLATMGYGAVKYNVATGRVKFYTKDPADDRSLSSNSVSSIMRDSAGNLWFSTDRGGICRYNAATDDFSCFSIENGLPDDVAYGILEDSNGYLWFGTNRGLVKFNPKDESVRIYTTKEGLCSNQFNYKSAVEGSDGRFYFGTIGGLVSFDPEADIEEQPEAPIYFTRLSIANEEVTKHTPDSPLKVSILETDKITLPYDKASINLDVALLSYSSSLAKDYYYRLEPVDKQWIRTSQDGIRYANLSPGEYVLHVSATGDVNATAARSLAITILPPWWQTTTAMVCWFILIVCIFTVWFIWYRHHKNQQLVERQKLFEIEKEKELYESKVDFFTEIAHEIRTPLTLINGPLEIIKEQGEVNDPQLAKNLRVIGQNTRRLLDLASQLLDFQKIGANRLKLKYETVDVSQLLQETVARFEPTFAHDNKALQITRCEEHLIANIDREAVTKIFSNLLTNALKYGRREINVELSHIGGEMVVKVQSDGEKIPAERAEQIFEPFYQLDNRTREKRGVGIGLSLSRSLAMAHKGTLVLDTATGDDANTFVLTIPLNPGDGSDAVNVSVEPVLPVGGNDNNLLAGQGSEDGNVNDEEAVAGCRILVVEDEADLLEFICERLSETFEVERAVNGKEALDVLQQGNIDLILSDVMMPVMNGIDMCRSIKTDLNLCHIPVIFLTAKNDINSKIAGLKAGAESYIEKPFSFDYLKSQIVSLLSNRRKEREAFSKRPFFPMKNVQMSKEDETFMERAVKVINDNITDEQFNVERLAEELCMSRSSLLRKIKSVFNLPPLDFIRLIKLKKAAELIQEGNYKVGEVCFMVGFSSHSYFSKLFNKQFGMTPKDFEKQVQSRREHSRGKSAATDSLPGE